MKMTTRVAFRNMRYNKSRNVLTGIAIILTTLLLFVVPTVGKAMIDVQSAAVNKAYPTWHALFRGVDESTVKKLAAHSGIDKYGLRSDVGAMAVEDGHVYMMYLDEAGRKLSKADIAEGRAPEREDEIVVSAGILELIGQEGAQIGDVITVPYQIFRDGGLDYSKEKSFTICGFFADSEAAREQGSYVSLISKDFLKNELPGDEADYRFLFQVKTQGITWTDQIEEIVGEIAGQFGISEKDRNINTQYLSANYIDPATVPAIALIMLIIVAAGIITIYSIYYVSMNQRVQEFGRLKAIGATRRQIRQIVLREGLCVAAAAIPIGLLTGTFASKQVLIKFMSFVTEENALMQYMWEVVRSGEVSVCHWWLYLMTIAVTICTVYLSLLKPMRTAAKVSEVEAMRYQDGGGKRRSSRKGYEFLTIGRLTCRNLMGNKKKSAVTIGSMAVTGIFLMVVATVLSCADPRESANSSILGQYEISPIVESGNKEHPELEWSEVQKDNPVNSDLKKQIESLAGVEHVDTFSSIETESEVFDEAQYICGVPEEYEEKLEKGIIEGSVTYEELKSGDQVIIEKGLLYWYPELKVGDTLKLTVHDADRTFVKEVRIAAIGDYEHGFTNYDDIIMAKEAADALCSYNADHYMHIYADKDYDQVLADSLDELVAGSGRLQMRTWEKSYREWNSALTTTSMGCYIFLAILAVISVMNLINTMINSVHVRRKELGMMQAIGMSDRQLGQMLQLEGLFYTAGTLLVSVGLGSLAGYPVFLYAKNEGMFNIRTYHYPVTAAVTISVALLALQIVLAVVLARSVKKESLIDRIRFSE